MPLHTHLQTPLPSDKVLLLPANLGPAVHLHATFSRGDASQVGFIIQAEKLAGTCGTAILYSWTEDQLLLTHDHAFDPATGVIRCVCYIHDLSWDLSVFFAVKEHAVGAGASWCCSAYRRQQ